jgi:hypothetical protein
MRRGWVGLVLGGIVALGASPGASPGRDLTPSPTPTPAPPPGPIDLEASMALEGPSLAVS